MNINFILLNGAVDFLSSEVHNKKVSASLYEDKDLIIEKLLAEKEELTKELEAKKEECKAKAKECEELKEENKKLNEIVVVGKTEIALRDETINKILSQPKVRRLKASAVKEIIERFTHLNEAIDKDLVLCLASEYNVTVKTIINLYTRKTHAKAWSMLGGEALWVIKQDIGNLV